MNPAPFSKYVRHFEIGKAKILYHFSSCHVYFPSWNLKYLAIISEGCI